MSGFSEADAQRMQRRVNQSAGRAVESIIAELPRAYIIKGPPLWANNYKVPGWFQGKNQMVLTKEAREWFKQAEEQLKKQHGILLPIDREVFLYMDVFRPRNAGDWDNAIKTTQDAMQNAGILKNDSIVRRGIVTKYTDVANPRITITITESSLPPLK